MTALIVIAIDGPAGAGKSTVGRAVARRIGLEYLDTGAMYRAVTFAAMRRGVPVHDAEAVAELAREVTLEVDDDGVRVDGTDATVAIRGRDVTQAVSVVAANSGVRSELVERQREWVRARGGGVVEGRDIASGGVPRGTVEVVRDGVADACDAERRVGEIGGDVDEVESAIVERDRLDSTRADSPLREVDGAIVVDTSEMSIDEVVDRIVEMLV